jgi:hypothetical protein
MREKINEEVSMVSYYNARKKIAKPHLLSWQNRDYSLGEVDYHHTVMEGRTLHHIYEMCDKQQTLWFRLNLDTSNQHWLLEAIDDGITS